MSKNEPRTLVREHEGSRTILNGPRKLVANHQTPWTLHNIDKDPMKIQKLAATESGLADQLKKMVHLGRSRQRRPLAPATQIDQTKGQNP